MISPATLDVRELVTGTGAFGPTEIKNLLEALGSDPAAHRDLRGAVQEMERAGERSPAASVRLGVCQQLLGRSQDALATLKSGDGGALALYYQGRAHVALGATDPAHVDKACEAFEAARKAGYDAAACAAASAEALRSVGRPADAVAILEKVPNREASADYWALKGAMLADEGASVGDIAAALGRAITIDPGHPTALFMMGVMNDRLGNDDEAKACYEESLKRYPGTVGALVNLGLLCEDEDDFSGAQRCYKRVLEAFPDHPRARLFLKDSTASDDLKVEQQTLRTRDRLDQVMGLPVTDFELSVRSRNCLQKMGVMTLGDLARTSEAELLESKNFGETSLVEIKEMLASKGLSLGQMAVPAAAEEAAIETAEPSADEQEIYSLPIAELNLSVRARKCTTKLGIATIGELVRRTGEDLMECKNFGVTSLNEVREKLTERGLKLRGD
jgi:DNA-directed RNA polymerase subunit alpha